jgi:hypothetical protein
MFWTRDAVGSEARRRGTGYRERPPASAGGQGKGGDDWTRTVSEVRGAATDPPGDEDTRAAARGRVSEASDRKLGAGTIPVPGSLARGRR